MTLPAFLLGIVFASLYGTIYHLVRGGGRSRALFYLLLGWAGFATGHWLAEARGWDFIVLGPLNLGFGTIGSYVFLGMGDWLSRATVRQDPEV
jgi:hypothetical protein